jgi:DNA-directed RNA polymerase subunit beta'
VHINVQEGERVAAGDPLMDGPRNPHDILDVRGEKELQKYLVNEIQEVYRLQGVNINDKHLEVISRQMMRWVKVEDIGDTEFLPEEVVDKFKFRAENREDVRKRAAVRRRARPCCWASPRRRFRPIRSSRRRPSRRPRACSPKPPSTARWTTCAA